MALFSISDLHLPLGVDKPMDVFGSAWDDYVNRLEKNWRECVRADDWVVLPGDFCWALHLSEAKKDFDFLDSLPGVKILLKGNHDYWWDTVSKLRRYVSDNAYSDIQFLQNNSYLYRDIAICGTRLWNCPAASGFGAEDDKIYEREIGRAALSLADAVKRKPKEILFFTHYPPVTAAGVVDPGFLALMQKYGVIHVLYGHIHGTARQFAFVGEQNGIKFDLVSCDYLEFIPKKLTD